MHDEECKEAEHGEEVNGSGRLPATKDPRVPRKAIHHGGRHGDPGKNRQRAEDKDDGEIGDLLQCVVAIKPVRFRGQVKRRVVHPRVPCLQEDERRSRHNTPPLLGIEEHDDEENAGDDEAVHVDEVPNPRNTNCVPVARRANQRRNITGIVFRGPDAVAWNLQRRNPDPFAPRRAAIVEIQTRMIHQDGQTAANQHHHKKEIEEVAVTHPDRKPVRSREVVGIYLRNGWNMRQSGHGDLNPRRRDYREDRDTDSDQDGRSNPEAKSAIGRIVDGSVCRIERDHAASELPHVANTVSPVAHETTTVSLYDLFRPGYVSRMAAYAALSAPQLQFSAGPVRFFFEAHPNSLKLLDQFRFRQAGVSERRAFSFYLDRASLVEHLL